MLTFDLSLHGYSLLDKANLIDLYKRVHVGRRVAYGIHKTCPDVAKVELKFEHRNSKDCSYGPLYEWQLYMYASDPVRLGLLESSNEKIDSTSCG
uniref:Uncharacterized protein n=1 Tax=Lactuca sativa TaxID=4236 RepID=A0A9R1XYE9_LACSA|nr:hypothetical protein LSAT_V11C100015720 [Lactuca sativa]